MELRHTEKYIDYMPYIVEETIEITFLISFKFAETRRPHYQTAHFPIFAKIRKIGTLNKVSYKNFHLYKFV